MKDHFITVSAISEYHEDKEGFVGGTNANFSKYFGLKKIGVHYFKIPPGLRTSRPHAESIEEEFVYIIQGEMDLWLNGKIKRMVAGDCIGFPGQTGVGHCFINNSEFDVEIFVAGDRTKEENKYRFHLEPSLKSGCGENWWEDMPEQELGSHDGLPGIFDEKLIDNSIETFNGPSNLPKESYSYPGDLETFTYGVCLSRKFDLKNIAIWLEKLPPGKRTSWPHAHSTEEEFVYVLEGKPDVWLNGNTIPVSSETGIDFKAGSGVAHTLINKTNEDIYYICVGECEPENDKIFYPEHPRRNEEIKKEGGLWENIPVS
ncbi:MAG: putative cupin superfamily protein [Bacteriovoracaceae bacterium]|jgi:uncharacterized cupin superfamily protein